MTTPALVKQADLMRAIRAAKKLGAARVSIGKDGTIVFDIERSDNHMLPLRQPDQGQPLVRIRPTKKVTL
jgi:hypothetical protein